MRLYYWESPFGNVGDDLNRWLWPRLFGDVFDDDDETVLIGIGSILAPGYEKHYRVYRKKIVLGAGARSAENILNITSADWDVRFVRGPRTARSLGLDQGKSISDPAILVPRLLPNGSGLVRAGASRMSRNPVIGFVPYFATTSPFSSAVAAINNLKLIPVNLDPDRFFQAIASCDAVVAEAMHGAIIADALGIPWMPCRISNWKTEGGTHEFKWGDWLDTLDLSPNFITLVETSRLPGISLVNDLAFAIKVRIAARSMRRALANPTWMLSDRSLLAHRQEQMLQVVEKLKSDLLLL